MEFGTADPADGFSYGIGIQFKQLNLDYAMTPDDGFDDVHRLSFGYSFGSGGGMQPEEPKPEEPKQPEPEAPKGPAVIAQADPPAPSKKAPAPTASTSVKSSAPATQAAPKVEEAPKASQEAPAEKAAAPAAVTAKTEAAPAPTVTEYLVVLPGYPSKDSAEAEMKALELLGFKTKNAQIVKDPKRSGWKIAFSRLKSKGSAEDMASDLQRMSFRALVEVTQR
jgi:hypothetical protein